MRRITITTSSQKSSGAPQTTTKPRSTGKQLRKRHARIRSDHSTELAEDYVEAIAELIANKGTARAVDLTKRFGVSHVSVSRALGRLERDGYVETKPYAPVTLTTKGKKLAQQSAQRHKVVREFLLALGVSPSTATIDSEGIEHHVSTETLRAMKDFVEKQKTLSQE